MVHIIGLSSLLFWIAAASPEQRAADYLSQEVPKWARENHCYSCHNNGDAARALFAARRAGLAVSAAALADTVEWLRTPAKWSETHGAAGVTNVALANVQFAAALLDSGERDLRAAVEALVRLQDANGSWISGCGRPCRSARDVRGPARDVHGAAGAGGGIYGGGRSGDRVAAEGAGCSRSGRRGDRAGASRAVGLRGPAEAVAE